MTGLPTLPGDVLNLLVRSVGEVSGVVGRHCGCYVVVVVDVVVVVEVVVVDVVMCVD